MEHVRCISCSRDLFFLHLGNSSLSFVCHQVCTCRDCLNRCLHESNQDVLPSKFNISIQRSVVRYSSFVFVVIKVGVHLYKQDYRGQDKTEEVAKNIADSGPKQREKLLLGY